MKRLTFLSSTLEKIAMKQTQNQRLENYLRGTGRELNAAQAKLLFGIKNLRARMSDFRQGYLKVNKRKSASGSTMYSVPRRDQFGGQYKWFV
jgi:hypothetical protein